MSDVLILTEALISEQSITSGDAGCQELLAELLAEAGFQITHLPSGKVSNLLAIYGTSGPLFAFAGHTDVVPAGKLEDWHSPPFEPTVVGGKLYGRGAQDMKGPLAAMALAAIDFVEQYPDFPGRIALLITSGEEGEDYLDGTPVILQHLNDLNIPLNWCVVGEPSSQNQLGDVVRNGRRGSLKAYITIHGKQGHVAYPHQCENPLHKAHGFISKLIQHTWCEGSVHFPPTVMQCTHIETNTKTMNIVPGELTLWVAFRYSNQLNEDSIRKQLETFLTEESIEATIKWEHSGHPFLTEHGRLTAAVNDAIQSVTQITPEFSTSGGTSDGRFIATTGAEVVEVGCCNDSIHQINEAVEIKELEQLQKIYFQIAKSLLVINNV